MSKAYTCESRRRANGAWTAWRVFGYNPNLKYARDELFVLFCTLQAKEDREGMADEWERLKASAVEAEVGDVLECDERQWRIMLE